MTVLPLTTAYVAVVLFLLFTMNNDSANFILTTAYVAVVLFLLLLILGTAYRWYVKAGVILICSVFYGVVWHTLPMLEGWPVDDSLPEEFQLVSQYIVQPDKHEGTQGVIYMWVIDLADDADRIPRVYQLPYTERLHEKIIEATGSGEIQKGKRMKRQSGSGAEGTPVDRIQFQPLPVNRLPPKD